MDVSSFDYELPAGLIAQEPARPRDASRLLVAALGEDRLEDRRMRDLGKLLNDGDLLIVNDTRVLKARLFGRKVTGGQVEAVLLERLGGKYRTATGIRETWRAQIGASRAPSKGARISLDAGYSAHLVSDVSPDGTAAIDIDGPDGVEALMSSRGRLPLPPYICRSADEDRHEQDASDYQTIFAAVPGAVAAPTAGLHLTEALLENCSGRGVRLAKVTLHVGEGTFRPVRVDRVEEISLHSERYTVPDETVEAIAETRARNGRVVAVGTTVVRALESRPETCRGVPRAGGGRTRLCIVPGHRFQFIDGLLTNFHLPRSTLVMLVSAFMGRERLMNAYSVAIDRGYRFYSYGDAMLMIE